MLKYKKNVKSKGHNSAKCTCTSRPIYMFYSFNKRIVICQCLQALSVKIAGMVGQES